MKYVAIAFTAIIISASAFAEPKLIVCKSLYTKDDGGCKVGDVLSQTHFLVETDDFSKEKPEYEYQMVYSCLYEVMDASKKKAYGYKQKYRYAYDVTPTTLTFHYDAIPESGSDLHLFSKTDINRETLTTKHGKCTIEDVILDNKI